MDLSAVRHQVREELSREECYRSFAALGIQFGAAFRGIERLWRTDGEALAQVRLPAGLELERQRYCFHPALLDACFQAVSKALPRDHASLAGGLYLPVRIERVRVYRSSQPQMWIRDLDDASNRTIGILEYELGDRTQLFVIGSLDGGNKDAEFGSLLKYSLMAGVRLTL